MTHLFDRVGVADCDRFHAQVGDPAFNTLWEALAVLVAPREWADRFSPDRPVEIRSDNLGVLYALYNRAAPARAINLIMQEVSLAEALWDFPLRALKHIPGLSNVTADALSRQFDPKPKDFPAELLAVTRAHVAHRTRKWYRTLKA